MLSILINYTSALNIDADIRSAMVSCIEIESMNTIVPEYGSFVALRLETIQRNLEVNNKPLVRMEMEITSQLRRV